MEDKKYMPLITATSIEEFTKLTERLNELPTAILEQIIECKGGLMSFDLTFKKFHNESDSKPVYLPSSTRQITNMGDYIAIYSDEGFYRLPIQKGSPYINFSILPVQPKTINQ